MYSHPGQASIRGSDCTRSRQASLTTWGGGSRGPSISASRASSSRARSTCSVTLCFSVCVMAAPKRSSSTCASASKLTADPNKATALASASSTEARETAVPRLCCACSLRPRAVASSPMAVDRSFCASAC